MYVYTVCVQCKFTKDCDLHCTCTLYMYNWQVKKCELWYIRCHMQLQMIE